MNHKFVLRRSLLIFVNEKTFFYYIITDIFVADLKLGIKLCSAMLQTLVCEKMFAKQEIPSERNLE
jgi:hypothetical protein